MQLRYIFGTLCAAASFCAAAAIPVSEQVVAVEFYHAGLDHYFISAAANEISDLDTGVHVGWARTGYRFSVIRSGSTYPGTAPMCRFYSPTLSSHFYTAKASECEDVKVKFANAWQFESGEVFRAFLVDPNTGVCPADTEPVYRLYNNRPDVNHRYSTQLSVFVFMKGKGHIPEGDGNPALPVAFCTPAGGDVVPPPSVLAPTCTVTASNGTPAPGSTVTLSASCTNNPTSFLWTGCASTQGTCLATKATTGAASYTLHAANAQGPADPVTVSVNWGGGAGAVPICMLNANNLAPVVGASITLSATCSQGPASYEWLECAYYVPSSCSSMPCSAMSASCVVTSAVTAYTRYVVAAVNSAGAGPRAELQIEWRSATGGGFVGGFCGQVPRAKRIVVPWGDFARYATVDYGGWPADTVIVMEFTVPSSPPAYGTAGDTSLAEYDGPPALRHMTLSRTACDFRDPDPAGASGPFAATVGSAVLINWNVGAGPIGLSPGQTYYFNFRNLSCGQLTCEASTSTSWPR